jgi:stress response protein YsnF
MKKSELKALIEAIVTELKSIRESNGAHPGSTQKWDDEAGYDIDDPKHPDFNDSAADDADYNEDDMMMGNYNSGTPAWEYEDDLREAKKLGASTMKNASTKKSNTKMKSKATSITTSKKPTEKKEGSKLPIVKKKSNTTKNHVEKAKSTPSVPKGKSLKEEITNMIRESIEEMARVKGAVSNKDRIPDPKSPTGYKHRVTGVPVPAPKNTGANYVKKGVNPNMGRPTANQSTSSDGVAEPKLKVSFIDVSNNPVELDFDFLNSTWPQTKAYLEREVMAEVPDAFKSGTKIGQEVYQKLEDAKEAADFGKLRPADQNITLYYDPATRQLRVKR